MNAKQARDATKRAETERERKAREKAEEEKRQQVEADAYSRKSAYPEFMKKVRLAIVAATTKAGKYVVVDTTNKIVAELVVGKLVDDGYEAHSKHEFVDAENSYGDSGEGMHDAYDQYIIHINWGRKGHCPACDEDFDRARRR